MTATTVITESQSKAVPSRSLDYRAALLTAVVSVALVAASFLPFYRPAQAVAISGVSVIEATNLERVKHGLSPLTFDAALANAAAQKARDMVEQNYFGHYYNDTTPWQFIIAAGSDSWQFAGENLAKNYQTAGPLLTAWMNSELHRANILNPSFDRIGVAVVVVPTAGDDLILTVQFFTG